MVFVTYSVEEMGSAISSVRSWFKKRSSDQEMVGEHRPLLNSGIISKEQLQRLEHQDQDGKEKDGPAGSSRRGFRERQPERQDHIDCKKEEHSRKSGVISKEQQQRLEHQDQDGEENDGPAGSGRGFRKRQPERQDQIDCKKEDHSRSESSLSDGQQKTDRQYQDKGIQHGASRMESAGRVEQGKVITNKVLKFKLFEAAAAGDIQQFVENKELINGQNLADYDMRTPLHLAAAEGHLNVVKYLIEELQYNPESKDRNKKTAYDEAVKEKRLEVVEYLKFKMNHIGLREKHQVIEAAWHGDLQYLKSKFEQGVKMSISNYDQRTPLHLAAAEGHIHVVKFLIEECKVDAYVKDRFGQTALDEANKSGRYEIVDLFRNQRTEYYEQNRISI